MFHKFFICIIDCLQFPDSPPQKQVVSDEETKTEDACESYSKVSKNISDNEEKTESAKKKSTPEKESPKKIHNFFSKWQEIYLLILCDKFTDNEKIKSL